MAAASDEFIKAATGNAHRGLQWLHQRAPEDAFNACLAFAVSKPDLFVGFWDALPFGESPSDLMLDLVRYGFMPQRPYSQARNSHYHLARKCWLSSFDKGPTPRFWSDRTDVAYSVCMFPDYGRNMTLAARVVKIAEAHKTFGPSNSEQGCLFSLGGHFTFKTATSGTTPQGTTCMLVARSIWHAAGVNVIGSATPETTCNIPSGLYAELRHLWVYETVKKGAAMPSPIPGDIFHIKGQDFKAGTKQAFGSDHVGIVTAVAGNSWTCVQGGAGNHVTKSVEFKVEKAPDRSWGDWHFVGDSGVSFTRGIQGFWKIGRVTNPYDLLTHSESY